MARVFSNLHYLPVMHSNRFTIGHNDCPEYGGIEGPRDFRFSVKPY
jgi:hypothetical protein